MFTGRCLDVGLEALLQFCRNQQNIEVLNIDYCRKILVDNPATCLSLFEALSKNLKSLSMKGLSSPRGMKDCFEQLDYLQSLILAECDIPSRHVFAGLLANRGIRENLSYLNLNSLGIGSPENFIELLPTLTNLTHLEMRNEHAGVTDHAFQAIASNCKKLNVLVLSNCTQLTDCGFIGIANVDSDFPNHVEEGKIFLGSKAEAELRQDIRRIHQVSVYSADDETLVGGINSLKSLVRLELENLRISEISLMRAFKFDHLRCINLSLCKSISEIGFRHLATQNPYIEVFIAKQCNLSGETISHIAENCKRLRKLDIEGCHDVTNDSIKSLPNYCQSLRHLDVSFCKRVRTATLSEVQSQMRLKTIGSRGLAIAELLAEDSDEENELNNEPPLPPPPPPHMKKK